ncbi:MAG: hypothetical protein ABL971_14845 [Vicinamibacterales bacterium]
MAASRVQGRHHYPSDVLFGAAIGLASGRTATLGRGRRHVIVLPSLTRGGFMLTLVPHLAPNPDGAAVRMRTP